MEALKKRFSFLKKYLFSIKIVLVLLFSSASIGMAYLYGTTRNQTKIDANLMQVDYEVKQQKNTNFLHGYLNFDGKLTKRQKYDKAMDTMKKALYKLKYFNMYMVSANEGDDRLYQAETGVQGLDWSDFKIVMVRNFWDYKMMESLALPLFRHEGEGGKNGIRPVNDNADAGSYISARTAYKFVTNNGMLEKNNGDVVAAFNELLDSKEYFYSVDCASNPLSKRVNLSINNIYLTDEYSYLMEPSTRRTETRDYRNYLKTFSFWNDEAVVTYNFNIFVQGFNFVFDIAGSFFNYSYFIKNLTGTDFFDNEISLKFIGENTDLTNYSDEVNKYSVGTNSAKYLFLILSIILFAMMVFAFIWMFNNISKIKSKSLKIILYLLPIMPFVLVQFFFHIYLMLTSNILKIYLIFNSTGNTVIVLYTIVCLIYCLLWSVINEE